MEELKNTILNLIKSGSSGQYDLKTIGNILNLNSTAGFVMLNKALNQLEDDYILVRNKNDKYFLAEQAYIYRGIISVNSKGKGFLDLENYSISISNENLNGAFDKDEVIVKILKKVSLTAGSVVKVIKHNTTHAIGTINYVKNSLRVKFDDEKLNNYRSKVVNIDEFKLVDGIKVMFKIVSYPVQSEDKKSPLIKLKIERVIGHKNDPGVDILSILLNYDIDPVFSDEVLNEAQAIPQKVTDEQKIGRKDLTDLTIVTIDGDDAKDFDDAISIEQTSNGFLLGVHIADVSYYVTKGSSLDNEARNRGTSTYVVDRVVPMLPHVLSNGICSLNPNLERLTLTCMMNVDYEGNIVDYELFESVIKSKYRMTYNNVNKLFKNDKVISKKYSEIKDMFFLMQQCASVIRKRRSQNGSIDFDKDEAQIVVNEKGKVLDIKKRERGESERIIEDFMILANECVAKHLRYLNIPALYRIHETPKTKKMEEFKKISSLMGHNFKYKGSEVRPIDIQKYLNNLKGDDDYTVVSTLMLRSMQKARYDAVPLGHFGLSLKDYLHFTSPIRRYPDLIVHRMLRKYCFENDFDNLVNDEKLMGELSIETSDRERAAIDAERDVESMKMAEYMSERIGKIYEGIISSVTKFGFFVELENLVEGLVHIQTLHDDYYNFNEYSLSLIGERTANRYFLGQKVIIKVVNANKTTRTIDFELLKQPKPKTKAKSNISRWR